MDPDATLQRLLLALDAGDRATVIQALHDLTEWVEAGGLLPTPPPFLPPQ